MSVDIDALRSGQRRALAKAITLVESARADHQAQAQEVLEALMPDTGGSMRVGISGTPGVGKSTFIEALGQYLIGLGKRVAVLAVDPSSALTGGSLLGDKTRMEKLSRSPEAFIRPSPSGGALGGVAHATREALLLCEAAGFDVVLVETVGVGQSEFEVADMVDRFLVLVQPFAGDDIQGIKKGILELADFLIVNKSDGPGEALAAQTKRHYRNALALVRPPQRPLPVMACSSIAPRGIDRLWEAVSTSWEESHATGALEKKRAAQNLAWFRHATDNLLRRVLIETPTFLHTQSTLDTQVVDGSMAPLRAARHLIDEALGRLSNSHNTEKHSGENE